MHSQVSVPLLEDRETPSQRESGRSVGCTCCGGHPTLICAGYDPSPQPAPTRTHQLCCRSGSSPPRPHTLTGSCGDPGRRAPGRLAAQDWPRPRGGGSGESGCSMGGPGLVLVWLSWVLRGGSDNVDAAADADATFQGPARPVWKQESERCRRACGCPGSWQVASSREAGGWPPGQSVPPPLGSTPLSPQKRDLRPPGVGAVLGAAYRGCRGSRRDPGRPGPEVTDGPVGSAQRRPDWLN